MGTEIGTEMGTEMGTGVEALTSATTCRGTRLKVRPRTWTAYDRMASSKPATGVPVYQQKHSTVVRKQPLDNLSKY